MSAALLHNDYNYAMSMFDRCRMELTWESLKWLHFSCWKSTLLFIICLHISAALRNLASNCMFACACACAPCVTVNKKQCYSMEPHGAETCQHSQLQFPMPAPMLSHDLALGRKLAKHCAFLSCCFQGKLLLSRIFSHKHLNISASAANRLQQCEGNVYNYPWFVQ